MAGFGSCRRKRDPRIPREGEVLKHWNPDFAAGNPLLSHLPFPRFENWPDYTDYDRILAKQPIRNENGKKIRFVEPLQTDYETRIFETGKVNTRHCNWHDFFNALAWLHFPKSKGRINAMHHREGCESRNPVRDALTHFDETGVIVISSSPELSEDLRHFRWRELFWEKRKLVERKMRFLIFGHGLMEKALHPYVGMTGKGIVLEAEISAPEEIDAILASRIGDLAAPSDLTPVPVLGYPGWDENNADPAYYENLDYFRKGRMRQEMKTFAK